MIDISNHSEYSFYQVCDIERSKKNKLYSNAIAIPLSAVDGSRGDILENRMFLIKQPQIIDSEKGLGVITAHDGYDVEYLFYILKQTLQNFLEKYQCGININPEIFSFYKLDLHNDLETQKYIASLMNQFEEKQKRENEIINKLQNIKQYYLDNMFVDCDKTAPRKKTILQQGLFDF